MTGITNGGFETGDLTAWTIWRNPETTDSVVEISSVQHHTGSYSCRLYCHDTTGDTTAQIYQEGITPTTSLIGVWVNVTTHTGDYASLTIEFQKDTSPFESLSTSINTTTSGWQLLYLDISSLSDLTIGTLRIYSSAGALGEEEAFVDDVIFSSASPPRRIIYSKRFYCWNKC